MANFAQVNDFSVPASGTLLSALTDDLGNTFSRASGALGNSPVMYGTLLADMPDDYGVWVNSAVPPSADYTVTCAVKAGGYPSEKAGVAARVSASAKQCYAAYFSAANHIVLVKYVAGTRTVLGDVTSSSPGSALPLVLSCQGGTIAVSYDGTEVISVTDTDITAAGKAAIYFDNSDGPALGLSEIHSFSAASSVVPLTAGTLSAGSVTSTTVPLTYATVTNGTAPYSNQFQRSANGTTGWTNTGSPVIGATATYTDNGRTPSTDYYYRVVTVDSAGSPATATSNVVHVTTSAAPTGGGADIVDIRAELDARGLTAGLAAAVAALVAVAPTHRIATTLAGAVNVNNAQPSSDIADPPGTDTMGGLWAGGWCPTLADSTSAFAAAIIEDPANKIVTDSGGGVIIAAAQISVLGTQLLTGTVVSATQQSVTVAPTGGTVFPATANLYTGPDAPRFLHFLGTGPLGGEVVEISGYTPPSGSGVNATFTIKSAMRAVPGTGVAVQVE